VAPPHIGVFLVVAVDCPLGPPFLAAGKIKRSGSVSGLDLYEPSPEHSPQTRYVGPRPHHPPIFFPVSANLSRTSVHVLPVSSPFRWS